MNDDWFWLYAALDSSETRRAALLLRCACPLSFFFFLARALSLTRSLPRAVTRPLSAALALSFSSVLALSLSIYACMHACMHACVHAHAHAHAHASPTPALPSPPHPPHHSNDAMRDHQWALNMQIHLDDAKNTSQARANTPWRIQEHKDFLRWQVRELRKKTEKKKQKQRERCHSDVRGCRPLRGGRPPPPLALCAPVGCRV